MTEQGSVSVRATGRQWRWMTVAACATVLVAAAGCGPAKTTSGSLGHSSAAGSAGTSGKTKAKDPSYGSGSTGTSTKTATSTGTSAGTKASKTSSSSSSSSSTSGSSSASAKGAMPKTGSSPTAAIVGFGLAGLGGLLVVRNVRRLRGSER